MKLLCLSGLLIFTLILTTHKTYSQANGTVTYSGTVIDSTDGESLISANVYIKELNFGSSTNMSGYFVIPNIPPGEYTLNCSYIGYKQQSINITVTVDCENCITIYLSPQAYETEQVVVSGDSVATIDRLFSRPVSQIEMTPQQINKIPKFVEADLLRALQTLPGVTA